ncbi:hypothetical protein PLESTB_001709100 [Pleodorina starrii]|uniref:Uncharacterized protein n=1 Tax=Pleodorina starrii TaxID=330485 RepID=A0A9W6F9W4_9CHLO|nr:hypothetical protein PLESTB_001709100 [Pleodorina starrii]
MTPVLEQDDEDDGLAKMDALRQRAAQFIPVNTPRGFVAIELASEPRGSNTHKELRTKRKQAKVYEHVLGSGPSAVLQKHYERYALRPGKDKKADAELSASSCSVATLQARCARALAEVPPLSLSAFGALKAPATLEASPRPQLSPRPLPHAAIGSPAPLKPSPRPAAAGRSSVPRLPLPQSCATPTKAPPATTQGAYPAAAASASAQSRVVQQTAGPASSRAGHGTTTPRAVAATSKSVAVGQTTPRTPVNASRSVAAGQMTPRGAALSPRSVAAGQVTPRGTPAGSRSVAVGQMTPRAAAGAAASTPRSPRYVTPRKPVVPLTPRGIDAVRYLIAANATAAAANATAAAPDAARQYDTGMASMLDELVLEEMQQERMSLQTAAEPGAGIQDKDIDLLRRDGKAAKGAAMAEWVRQSADPQEEAQVEGVPASCRCGCAIM